MVIAWSCCQCLAAHLPPKGPSGGGPNWQQALLLQIGLTTELRVPEVHWADVGPSCTSHPGSRSHSPGRTAALPALMVSGSLDAVQVLTAWAPRMGIAGTIVAAAQVWPCVPLAPGVPSVMRLQVQHAMSGPKRLHVLFLPFVDITAL